MYMIIMHLHNHNLVIFPFGIANIGVYGTSNQMVALAVMLAGKGYSNIIVILKRLSQPSVMFDPFK